MTPGDLDLIEGFVHERLSENESASLRELLQRDPSARAYLRSLSAMESGLHIHALKASEMRAPISRSSFVRDSNRRTAIAAGEKDPREKRATKLFTSRIFFAAAAAIAGAAIILSLFELNTVSTTQHVAAVEYISDDARISTPAFSGDDDRVSSAPIEIESGVLRLRLKGGSVVTLYGPAGFIPMNGRGGTLVHGTMIGKAPADRSGLHIVGPNFDVTDLGTEFAIRANQTAGSDIYVIEGSVSLTSRGGAQVTANRENGFNIAPNGLINSLDKEQVQGAFGKVLIARNDPPGIMSPDTVAFFSFAGNKQEQWRDLAANLPVPATVPADSQTGAAVFDGTGLIKLGSRLDLLIDSPKSFEARLFIEHGGDLEMLFSAHSNHIRKNRIGWGVGIKAEKDGTSYPFFANYDVDRHNFRSAQLPIGRWFNLLFTIERTRVRVYVDGELKGESLRQAPMNPEKSPSRAGFTMIAGKSSSPNRPKIKVAHIAIHRRILTQEDMLKSIRPGDRP